MSQRTRSGRSAASALGTAKTVTGTFLVVEIRTATPDDEPAILRLLAVSMRRVDDPRFTDLYRWKHDQNHFGPSYRWVMAEGNQVVGVRLFMRWRFVGLGRTWKAVRAVDTATHPDHQGRGVFKALTLHALEAARDDGVDFVFNTPNDQSRPGYLKMGWRQVGTLRPMIRPRLRSLPLLARARVPASHWGQVPGSGTAVDEVADELVEPDAGGPALVTARSPGFARWRYPEQLLGYRALRTRGELAIVRCRSRGPIVEAVLAELHGDPTRRVDQGRCLLRMTGADAVVSLGIGPRKGLVPLPVQGPALVQRPLGPDPPPSGLARWQLTLGDIELF